MQELENRLERRVIAKGGATSFDLSDYIRFRSSSRWEERIIRRITVTRSYPLSQPQQKLGLRVARLKTSGATPTGLDNRG
jgi:hypothetical protein